MQSRSHQHNNVVTRRQQVVPQDEPPITALSHTGFRVSAAANDDGLYTNGNVVPAADSETSNFFGEASVIAYNEPAVALRESLESTNTDDTLGAPAMQWDIEMPNVIVASLESTANGGTIPTTRGKAPILTPGVKNFSRPVRPAVQSVDLEEQRFQVLSAQISSSYVTQPHFSPSSQNQPSSFQPQPQHALSSSQYRPSPSASESPSSPSFQESPIQQSSRFSGESQFSLPSSELQSNRVFSAGFGLFSSSRFGGPSTSSPPAPRKPSKLIRKFKARAVKIPPSETDNTLPVPSSPPYEGIPTPQHNELPSSAIPYSHGPPSLLRYVDNQPSSSQFTSAPPDSSFNLNSAVSQNTFVDRPSPPPHFVDYPSPLSSPVASTINLNYGASPRSRSTSPSPAVNSLPTLSPPTSLVVPPTTSEDSEGAQPVVLPGRPPSLRAGTPTSIYSTYSFYQLDSPSDSPPNSGAHLSTGTPTAFPSTAGRASQIAHQSQSRSSPTPIDVASRSRSPSPPPPSFPTHLGGSGIQTPQEYLSLGIRYHEANRLQDSAAYFEMSAKAQGGCGVGMLMWGLTLRHGWGCEKNEKSGFDWLRKAAESAVEDLESTRDGMDANAVKDELVLAIYEVGQCFFQGWGVPKDQKMAVSYYTVAAKLGDADAQHDLGFCLANGKGCKRDRREAAKWYRASVAQGTSDVGLAWIYKEKLL